eukprot:1653265-Pyramimonas_sp.AAC.1
MPSSNIQSVTTKGSLECPGQHCDVPTVANLMQRAPRAAARAHARADQLDQCVRQPMLTPNSNRSPLIVHLSSQANMATL